MIENENDDIILNKTESENVEQTETDITQNEINNSEQISEDIKETFEGDIQQEIISTENENQIQESVLENVPEEQFEQPIILENNEQSVVEVSLEEPIKEEAEFEFESVVGEPTYEEKPIIRTEYKDEEKELLRQQVQSLTDLMVKKDEEIQKLVNDLDDSLEANRSLRTSFERDLEEVKKFGSTKLLKDVLPNLDMLGTIIQNSSSFSDEVKAYVVGFEMIYNQIGNALKENNVTEIEIRRGEFFDADKHEAVDTVLVTKESEANRIYKIVNKGYFLHDRLLKPVKVIVTKLKQ